MDAEKRDHLRAHGFSHEMDLVQAGRCPSCATLVDPNAFCDDLSRREFEISGLCQSCQDQIFGSSACSAEGGAA